MGSRFNRFQQPGRITAVQIAERGLRKVLRPGVAAALLAALCAPMLGLSQATAQDRAQPSATSNPTHSQRANANTLGVISGGADGTYIRIAADLANVLDGEDLRILPIIGRGSLQNLRDIMFLRGTDIGIVQMDAREALANEGLQDHAIARLRYITRLYNEEIHIIASREISDIRQLDGKKVNIDKQGSGTNLTARLIFQKLGIRPEMTTLDQASSYERLRSGDIQAAVYVAGRPVRAIAEFQGNGDFHLLSVPFEGEIAETYFPATFASADYPQLIAEGTEVNTIAVGSVLAVFNWPERSDRYKRVERFVNAFFSRFDEFLLPGRHPKWKEVNLAADVPGWNRIKPAQDWINSGTAESPPQLASPNDLAAFMSGRNVPVSAADRERLFRDFLTWYRQRTNGGGER